MLGRFLLKARQSWQIGSSNILAERRTRRTLLPLIQDAPPLPAGQGDVAVHMLLDHARVLEGCWGVYSLLRLAEQPLALVIHDDGSLTPDDHALLAKIFPGVRLVTRPEADSKVEAELQRRGLTASIGYRRKLVFGLKLFDPVFFTPAKRYVLWDSDILCYRRPDELFPSSAVFRYSVDWGLPGVYADRVGAKLSGVARDHSANAGLLSIPTGAVDFERVERYIADPEIWQPSGTPNWYSEQAIYDAESRRVGGEPLSDRYQIATYRFAPETAHTVHFCGGPVGRNLFYSRGVPAMAADLLGWRD